MCDGRQVGRLAVGDATAKSIEVISSSEYRPSDALQVACRLSSHATQGLNNAHCGYGGIFSQGMTEATNGQGSYYDGSDDPRVLFGNLLEFV